MSLTTLDYPDSIVYYEDMTDEKKASLINDTQALILGFLHEGPLVGADIDTKAKHSGGVWNVTRSQLYRELKQLYAAGLIEAGSPIASRKQAVPYRSTDKGRKALAVWMKRDDVVDRPRNPWVLRDILDDSVNDSPETYRRAVEYYTDALSTLAVAPEECRDSAHEWLTAYNTMNVNYFKNLLNRA